MFSCEICEIFKNTYFEDHLRTTASEESTISGLFLRLSLTHFAPIYISIPPENIRKL